MADIAKAYVQIIPSARGMTDGLTKELSGVGGISGKSASMGFYAAFKKFLPIAAMGKLVKETLNIGASYEQSFGGIQEMYGENVNLMIRNAEKAWKSAYMSQDDYYRRTTGISAVIKRQATDMVDVAQYADKVMHQIADNAAHYGTDQEQLSNTYDALARGHYRMLTNLRLGYHGTQQSMQELLKDAQQMKAEMGEEVEYDIDNFLDVIDAIGVIQDSLKITGRAALEAETTFSGAFGAMKASAENFMTALFLNENIDARLADMLEGVGFFGQHLWKRMLDIVDGAAKALPSIIPNMIGGISDFLSSEDGLERFRETIVTVVNSAVETVPETTKSVFTELPKFLTSWVGENVNLQSDLAQVGLDLIGGIFNVDESGISIKAESVAARLITALGRGLYNQYDLVKVKGQNVLTAFRLGLISKAKDLFGDGEKSIKHWWDGIYSQEQNLRRAGSGLVDSLKQGFKEGDWSGLTKWYDSHIEKMQGRKVVFTVHGRYLGIAGLPVKSALGASLGGVIGPAFLEEQTHSADGFKKGLAYVPYDDFPAILHKGERVLTAQEATEYNRSEMNSEAVVNLLEGILAAVSSRGETEVAINLDRREIGRMKLAVI